MLGILSTSVSVMFVTPDVEALIETLADTYRAHFVRKQAWSASSEGEELECLAGICVTANNTVRAEGSLYWIIWLVICTVGFAARLLAALACRTPSYWLRRRWQLERCAQRLLGITSRTGATLNHDHATEVYEEYQHRYAAIHIDPLKFEKNPT